MLYWENEGQFTIHLTHLPPLYAIHSIIYSRVIKIEHLGPGRTVLSTDNSTRISAPISVWISAPISVWISKWIIIGRGYPYGWTHPLTIYIDIHKDIRGDVLVELSVLRTVRPGGRLTFKNRGKQTTKTGKLYTWCLRYCLQVVCQVSALQ